MYRDLLYDNQFEVILILSLFSRDFYLAWWTAIALQLWHRKSLDFDLFSYKKIDNNSIVNKIKNGWYEIERILIDNKRKSLQWLLNELKLPSYIILLK